MQDTAKRRLEVAGHIGVLADVNQPASVVDTLKASLLWASDQPLDPNLSYLLKAGSATVAASVEAPRQGIDVETGAMVVMTTLLKNEVGRVNIRLDRKLAVDTNARSRGTGGFILIDRLSNETVALGFVEHAVQPTEALDLPRERWPALTPESPWRSLAKAFCWRAVGSFGSVVLAFTLTHDRTLAAIEDRRLLPARARLGPRGVWA